MKMQKRGKGSSRNNNNNNLHSPPPNPLITSARAAATAPSRLDRKSIEKNRRIHMKGLYAQLVSLIPSTFKETYSLPDQLEQATNYIVQLRERVERLKKTKQQLQPTATSSPSSITTMEIEVNTSSKAAGTTTGAGFSCSSTRLMPPRIEVKELGTDCIEVILIGGMTSSSDDFSIRLSQVVTILEEGGAQVIGFNLSNFGNNIFRTIHAQIRYPRVGGDISNIEKRLRQLPN